MAIGFIRGTEVKLIIEAPMKDPLLLRIRDFNIAIRRIDCKDIILEG